MIALLLCVIAFATSLWASRKSMAKGLIAVLAWGYFYGILRANFPTAASHFIFDSSLIGFYFTHAGKLFSNTSPRLRTVKTWVIVLIAWPCFVCLLPLQNPLISLVGLRGNIFFLPMILVGVMLDTSDLLRLGKGIATMNLIALGFATAEYFFTVPRFFPRNEVTSIIYASGDVAGYQYYRIPSTFSSAHAFAGAMVVSLPILLGCWTIPNQTSRKRLLYLVGAFSGLLGVLMSATRVHFVIAAVLILIFVLTGNFGNKGRFAIIALLAVLGFFAANNARLGRFESLGNTEYVSERVTGSVNRTFWEVLEEYPIGNGLGGGGTSIPYFLQGLVRRPIAMENEYGRILLELGIVGLLLWVVFIGWFIVGSNAFVQSPWRNGRRLAWACCCGYFVTGMIGLGMLTAIPQSISFLLMIGWVAARPGVGNAGMDGCTDSRSVRAIASISNSHEYALR